MAQLTAKKSWKRWVAVAAAALLLLLAVAWAAGATVLSNIIEARLKEAGFTEVSVGGISLGWGTVRIQRLGLGDAGSLEDIAVDVALSSLTSGIVPAVRIEEVTARASLAEDGTFTIPGFTASEGGPAGLPVGAIEVANATLTLMAPQGEFTLQGQDLRAVSRDTRLDITGNLVLASPYGRLEGRADGTADLETAGLTLSFEVEDGDASFAAIRANGITGTISVEKNGGAGPAAQFDLRLAQPSIGEWPLAAHSLTGEWRDRHLTAQLMEAGDAPTTDVRLAADFSGDLPLIESSGVLALAQNGLTGTADFESQFSVDTAAAPMALRGQVRARVTGIHYPAWMSDADIAFAADFAGTSEALALTFGTPVTGRLSLDADLLPEALSSYAGQPLTFSAAFQEAARLKLAPPTFSAAPTLDIREAEGATTAILSSPLTFEIRDKGFLLDITDMEASAMNLRWQDTVANALGFNGVARIAGADDWSITGSADIEAAGNTGPASYEGLTLAWSGRIEAGGPSISLTPDECVEMHFQRLAFGSVTLSNVSPPCLDAPEGQALLVSEGEDLRFDIAVPAEAPLDFTLEAEPARHLRGRWPGGTLSGVSGATGIRQLTADLTDGALRLEAEGVALSDIGGQAGLSSDSSLKGSLKVGTIRSLNEPPFWTPLSLEASVMGSAAQYDFSAILSDALGILVFEAMGAGTVEAGSADLTLYPVNFLSGATEAGDISPFLAESISGLSGTISFDGGMAWGDSLSSNGSLKLEKVGATFASARMEGLDAEIDFASLWPPATMARETIRIASLEAGVPLTDGTVGLEKPAGAPPRIGPIRFELAGGTVTAEPFILDLGGTGDTRFTLSAQGVDLEQMIEQAEINGLHGTGTLEGRLPVVITADGLQVDDGGLQAITNGQLQYQPDVLPPFMQGDDTRAVMLRQVLQNFQYSQLSLSLGGGSGDNASQRVTLSAKGNNPDFLEGHPVELNIDFEGAILSALKSAVSITGAESLEQLLKEQERRNTP